MISCLLAKNWNGASSGAIGVKGLDNALKMAKDFIKNGYQIVIVEDDCDIFTVAYSANDEYNDEAFALITSDEAQDIQDAREQKKEEEEKEDKE